jgi:hypothetical protein
MSHQRGRLLSPDKQEGYVPHPERSSSNCSGPDMIFRATSAHQRKRLDHVSFHSHPSHVALTASPIRLGRLPRTRCRPTTSAMACAQTRFRSSCNNPVGSSRFNISWISASRANAHTVGSFSDRARRRTFARNCTRSHAFSWICSSGSRAYIRASRLCRDRRTVREDIPSPSSAENTSAEMARHPTGPRPC